MGYNRTSMKFQSVSTILATSVHSMVNCWSQHWQLPDEDCEWTMHGFHSLPQHRSVTYQLTKRIWTVDCLKHRRTFEFLFWIVLFLHYQLNAG